MFASHVHRDPPSTGWLVSSLLGLRGCDGGKLVEESKAQLHLYLLFWRLGDDLEPLEIDSHKLGIYVLIKQAVIQISRSQCEDFHQSVAH